MKKKVLALLLAVATVSAFTACGQEEKEPAPAPSQQTETTENTQEAEATEQTEDLEAAEEAENTEVADGEEATEVLEAEDILYDPEVVDEPSNNFEERVGKTKFESYDEIIGLLAGEEAYAYVTIKGYDGQVLLVADSVYDDQLGDMATTECSLYTMKDGIGCTYDGVVYTDGTGTPIAINDAGEIFAVTHTEVSKSCYGENGTGIPGFMYLYCVSAYSLDDNGVPESVFGFYRENNTVFEELIDVEATDVALYQQLYDEYFDSNVVSFTTVE